jgi:hypothetical protein
MSEKNAENAKKKHFGWFFKLGKNVKILFHVKDNADGYYLKSVLILLHE